MFFCFFWFFLAFLNLFFSFKTMLQCTTSITSHFQKQMPFTCLLFSLAKVSHFHCLICSGNKWHCHNKNKAQKLWEKKATNCKRNNDLTLNDQQSFMNTKTLPKQTLKKATTALELTCQSSPHTNIVKFSPPANMSNPHYKPTRQIVTNPLVCQILTIP